MKNSIVACRELVRPESHALCTPLCDKTCFPGPIERFWASLSLTNRKLSTRSGDTFCEKHCCSPFVQNRHSPRHLKMFVKKMEYDLCAREIGNHFSTHAGVYFLTQVMYGELIMMIQLVNQTKLGQQLDLVWIGLHS